MKPRVQKVGRSVIISVETGERMTIFQHFPTLRWQAHASPSECDAILEFWLCKEMCIKCRAAWTGGCAWKKILWSCQQRQAFLEKLRENWVSFHSFQALSSIVRALFVLRFCFSVGKDEAHRCFWSRKGFISCPPTSSSWPVHEAKQTIDDTAI